MRQAGQRVLDTQNEAFVCNKSIDILPWGKAVLTWGAMPGLQMRMSFAICCAKLVASCFLKEVTYRV